MNDFFQGQKYFAVFSHVDKMRQLSQHSHLCAAKEVTYLRAQVAAA